MLQFSLCILINCKCFFLGMLIHVECLLLSKSNKGSDFHGMTFVFSAQINDPDNPSVLIEGVLFRARYLGSTQLISEGQPSKAMRMMQAQEAVGRIKVN